jgi:hypothetical protein
LQDAVDQQDNIRTHLFANFKQRPSSHSHWLVSKISATQDTSFPNQTLGAKNFDP